MTAGGVVWLTGQALRYAFLRHAPTDPQIAAIPWLVGFPLGFAGVIGLAWPTGMDRDERAHLIIDSALGIGSLAVIWSQVVLPRWVTSANPAQTQMDRVGQWALFTGISVLIVFVVSSRRMGALPLTQLMLLLSGFVVLLASATLRELAPGKQSHVTVSLLGYWVAVCLITAMLQRSPLRPRRSSRSRLARSSRLPFRSYWSS